jgi:serine/threonine protein kinase
MEYLEGETLATRLEKGPMPLDLALRTAIEIAAALDAAHRTGVVQPAFRTNFPGSTRPPAIGMSRRTVSVS